MAGNIPLGSIDQILGNVGKAPDLSAILGNVKAPMVMAPSVAPVNLQSMESKSMGDVNSLLAGLQGTPDLSKIGVSQQTQDWLNNMKSSNTGWTDPALAAYTQGLQGGKDNATNDGGTWNWLYNGLNDTLGLAGSYARGVIDNTINGEKNIWNSNEPWYMKLKDSIENPLNNLVDTAGQDIKAGAQAQWKDWTDGKLGWGDVPGFGFLQGIADNAPTGNQINQDLGVNSLIDKTPLKNSLLNQGILGQWNGMLSNQNWMDNIPMLDMLHKSAQGIMNADPNGNSAIKNMAGLATTIATDPLSYAAPTGLATDMGKDAEMAKIAELQKEHGIDGNFTGVNDFMKAATDKAVNETGAKIQAAQDARAQALGKSMGFQNTVLNANDLMAEVDRTASQKMAQQMGIQNPVLNSNDLKMEVQKMMQTKYPNLPNVVDNALNRVDNTIKQAQAPIQEELANVGQIHATLAAKKLQDMEDTIKEARANVENANMNTFGVKVGKYYAPLGSHSEKIMGFINNPLYKSETTLDDANRYLAQDLINKVAKGDGANATKLENAIKSAYNVNDIKDLTKTQFRDLVDKIGQDPAIKRDIPDANVSQKVVNKTLNKTDFHNLMDEVVAGHVPWKDVQTQLESIINKVGNSPTKRSTYGSTVAHMVSDYWKNAPTKNFSRVANQRKAEAMDWVGNWLKESDKYQKVNSKVDEMFPKGNTASRYDESTINRNNTKAFDKVVDNLTNSKYTKVNNAETAFEHFMNGKWNKFNPRSLATGNKFVDSMANHLADANSQRVGMTAQHGSDMENIGKFIKSNKLTAKDMTDAIYHMEGKAPTSYGKEWVASSKAQQLASLVKPLLDRVATQEQKAGVLSELRDNYFPHVMNPRTDEELKLSQEFQQRHPELKNNSAQSKFDQSRTGFQTLADYHDYMDNLNSAMQKTKDPEELRALQDEYNRNKDLYKVDIPTALSDRIREGTRAMAMKDMQGQLGKYGMLVKNPEHVPNADMVKLDKEQVRKLGLNPEDQNYMHKDVLEGMNKVDELFNGKTINKTMRQINAITDIFRTGVTTFKLSHYRNNFIGNAINNMAAGVKLSDYRQANQLLKALRNGTLNDSQRAVIDSAYKHNVINGGFISDLVAHHGLRVSDPTDLEKFANMLSNNKLAKGARSFMEKGDDIFRLGNYINGLKKFSDEGRAAAQVRKYLFNYNELTNSDRKMRTVVPFWNWMKRNLPLQIQNLFEHPTIALNYERSKQAADSNAQGADWQKDTGFKLPFTNYYTSVASPTDDLKQLYNPLQMLGSMNPVPKMALETAFNKQLFTGNPISYGSKTVQAKDILPYLAKNFGVTGTLSDLLQSFAGTNNKTPAEVIDNYLNPQSKINQGRATPK